MSEKSKSPPAPSPALDDFAKFNRGIEEALKHVVTDAPTGAPPTVNAVEGVVTPPQQYDARELAPSFPRMNPEEESQIAYRATLRMEEERLAKLPKPPPIVTAPVSGVMPSIYGAAQQQVTVREGADDLHKRCYELLVRYIATGAIGQTDRHVVIPLVDALRAAIEWKPKPSESTKTTEVVVS